MIMVRDEACQFLILGWCGHAGWPAWCPVLLGPSVVGGQGLGQGSGDEGLPDGGETGKRGGEVRGPRPAGVDLDPDFALAADDPAGGVQQLVAQLLGLDLGEVAVEEDGLGPGDQVGGGQLHLQPRLVDAEFARREAAHAGLLDRFDPVLDPGVGPVTGLEEGELPAAGVGGHALVPPAVVGLHQAELPAGTVADVLRMTQQEKPADGSTHWTTRSMAARAGIGKDAVARIWSDHGLKPWKVDTFKISNDPRFEEKLVDVVGLYLKPPARAVVFSFDEKTQVQALDRTQPSLPMTRGRGETMTHDYKRNGTTDLFAALNVGTGEVLAAT